MKPLVSVVTPTRNRPESLELCRLWIQRQTYPNVEHIVVEDHYEDDGLKRTLTKALNLARGDIIIPVDDDDWYAPTYVQSCVDMLRGRDLAGHVIVRAYHLEAMRYARWRRGPLPGSIAFTRALVLKALWILSPEREGQPGPKSLKGLRYLYPCCSKPYSKEIVAFRAVYSEGGRSKGHDPRKFRMADPGGKMLRKWVGDDDAKRILALRGRLHRGSS